ncbi:MAG: DNA polymerase III subunit tau [Chlamydiae bacterium]|nr:DNA polymerase III subunit tau [Chlamydiota bacterium]
MFDSLIGNERVKGYLTRMVERGMVGQSFLFAGPNGIGKSLFAQALASLLIGETERIQHGNHPDVRTYRPEGKIGMHSIDSMRQFNTDVYLSPMEAQRKVFIIHDADRMLRTSANALLKTFEEPADDTVIILLSSSPENLLTTVLSRCRRVYFQPIENPLIIDWLVAHDIDREIAAKVVPFANGSLAEALRLCEHGEDEVRELVLQVLSEENHRYRDLQQFSKNVGDYFDRIKSEMESAARQELTKIDKENMSVAQRDFIEKEINGVVSINFQAEVDRLLQVVISWYRDLHLLQVGGDESLLVNKDHLDALKGKKKTCSLDKVQDLVGQMRLAVQRFAPIDSSLETLFLQLS